MTTTNELPFVLDAAAVERIKRKRAGFLECVERGEKPDAEDWQKNDVMQYAMGITIMDWILKGAPSNGSH